MAGNFKFKLVSPERVLVSADVSEVLVPGADGDFTVFAGHAPLISILRPGIMIAKLADGTETRTYVHGGFCEVSPDSLAVLAEKADEVAKLSAATIAAHLAEAHAIIEDGDTDDDRRHFAHTAVTHLNSLNGMPN